MLKSFTWPCVRVSLQVGEQPLLPSDVDLHFETEEEEAAWIVEQSLLRFREKRHKLQAAFGLPADSLAHGPSTGPSVDKAQSGPGDNPPCSTSPRGGRRAAAPWSQGVGDEAGEGHPFEAVGEGVGGGRGV